MTNRLKALTNPLRRVAMLVFAAAFLSACGGGGGGEGESPSSSETSISKRSVPYNTPPALNSSAWMSSIPSIEKATLSALTLPGTHDAGAYRFNKVIAPTGDGQLVVDGACPFVIGGPLTANVASDAAWVKGRDFGLTQNLRTLDQLRSGVRYLDLRVVHSVDGFYIAHGLLGDPVPNILSEIRTFIQNEAGPREIVMVSIAQLTESALSYKLRIEQSLLDSDDNVFLGRRVCGKTIHRDMSTSRHEQLIAMIESYLGPYLHRSDSSNGSLQTTPIGNIVRGGPKVIVSYPYPTTSTPYRYPDFLWHGFSNTNWSNKDVWTELRDDQQLFVDGHVSSGDPRLLELQWMLTAQGDVVTQSTKCYVEGSLLCGDDARYDSVHELSRAANPQLSSFIYKPAQAKINLIRVDFVEESPAVGISLDSPVAVCRDVTVSANAMCLADASVDDGSSDNSGTVVLSQAPPGLYPLGETKVRLTASDGKLRSSCGSVVSVTDNTGPVIKKLAASPTTLWPPNHQMVPISIDLAVVDNCDSKPVCRLTRVQSNEPEGRGEGAGNAQPDWLIHGDLGLELRAERSGSNQGRRYVVTVSCSDKFTNSTSDSFSVEVPHSAPR